MEATITENEINKLPNELGGKENNLYDNAFFINNPDHVLAEPKIKNGKFGEYFYYEGNAEVLDRIAPDWSGGSVSDVGALQMKEDKEYQNDNIAIEDTPVIISEEISLPKKDKPISKHKVIEEITTETDINNIRTFEEAMHGDINEGITEDEIHIYIWYKKNVGIPLSSRWETASNYSEPDDEKIRDWFEKGLVCSVSGKIIPSYLFSSENILARSALFLNEKSQIIEKWGERAAAQQEKIIQQIQDIRLRLNGTDSGLIIKLKSEIAYSFQIESINSMNEGEAFLMKSISASSSQYLGQPNLISDDVNLPTYKKTTFKRLPLFFAFGYWLKKYGGSIQLKNPALSKQEILEYYMVGKRMKNPYTVGTQSYNEQDQKNKFIFEALKKEADDLFSLFLFEQLSTSDRNKLELLWNSKYNNSAVLDTSKIPVSFTMCNTYKGIVEFVKPEKREAVAFLMEKGTGLLAYEVGVGKTASAIFTISSFLDAGYCKRPLICVPNQVYKQFVSEIKAFAPHLLINDLYNLSEDYASEFMKGEEIQKVKVGSISIITYEGLRKLSFDEETISSLGNEVATILYQESKGDKLKQAEVFQNKISTIMGRGMQGTMYPLAAFGFDFVCFDEAHKLKKLFTVTKSEKIENDEGQTQQGTGKTKYRINTGSPSTIAIKGFIVCRYILNKNKHRNVLFLTGTPFTNNPLEIFSMLSYLIYDDMKRNGIGTCENFFDTFLKAAPELTINSSLKPVMKEVIKGFYNLTALQSVIRECMIRKGAQELGVNRPQKYVLPYEYKIVDGVKTKLDNDSKVTTYLSMNEEQSLLNKIIEAYVNTGLMAKVHYEDGVLLLGSYKKKKNSEEEAQDITGIAEVDNVTEKEESESSDVNEENEDEETVIEVSLGEPEKMVIRILRALSFSRMVNLSPYLFRELSGDLPTADQYVNSSPKLLYTMGCIESVKRFHEANNEPVSGQIIYMNRGVEFFSLIREYLIDKIGFKPNEVAIITGKNPKNGNNSKEYIKNLFNGEIYNEDTREFEPVKDEERVKIIIGSASIKEGINLQRFTSVLYNLYLDWNPTDIEQLNGRAWRQGNLNKNLRIVIPLIADTIDIFAFQKLEEKTERVNKIWSFSNEKGVLNLDEFDPLELKYKLIRDPEIAYKLFMDDENKNIEQEIGQLNYSAQKIHNILFELDKVTQEDTLRHFIVDKVERFRSLTDYPLVEELNNRDITLENLLALVDVLNEINRKKTDKEGRKIIAPYDWTAKEENDPEQYVRSYHTPKSTNYEDDFKKRVKDLSRENNSLIKEGKSINLYLRNTKLLEEDEEKLEAGIGELKERKEYEESPEFKEKMMREWLTKKVEDKETSLPLSELVNKFSSLNGLLSDSAIKSFLKDIGSEDSCPPMKDGVRLIDEKSIKKLEQCISMQQPTKSRYRDAGTRTYTPERLLLHETIISKLFNNVHCTKRDKPVAIIIGGAPGSGKTTFVKKNLGTFINEEVMQLSPDEIKEYLPEYKGWNASSVQEESSDILNLTIDTLFKLKCNYDIIYDGTMNNLNKYKSLVDNLKEKGYDIFILYFILPKEEAKARALKRYVHRGRYIPSDAIDSFYDKNGKQVGLKILKELAKDATGYVIVDGVTGEITEDHGERFDSLRNYGEALNKKEKKNQNKEDAENKEKVGNKEKIEKQIKSLSLGIKYLTGDNKENAEKIIKALKTSYKYL